MAADQLDGCLCRAVLAERVDGVLVARPLSRDHTPFRYVLSCFLLCKVLHDASSALSSPATTCKCRFLRSREDECERVKKFGARIMTLDQIEGLKVRAYPSQHPEHMPVTERAF